VVVVSKLAEVGENLEWSILTKLLQAQVLSLEWLWIDRVVGGVYLARVEVGLGVF
jgi:hypothetical protein